jgi:hypothetical protein
MIAPADARLGGLKRRPNAAKEALATPAETKHF